jgi:P2-related tail formation protein
LAKKKENIALALAHKRSHKKMGGTPSLAVAHRVMKWFSKAQEHMLDLAKRDKIYKSICILYKLCFASSTRAVDGDGDRDTNEEDIDNPDAMAYG